MTPDFSSYDNFKASTLGYQVDNGTTYDYCQTIWWHLGKTLYTYPPYDTSATNHGIKYAYINTDARISNLVYHISLVQVKTKLKYGDLVITTDGQYGNAGFVDGEYDAENDQIPVIMQGLYGTTVTEYNLSLSHFAGAFRYDAWNAPDPEPEDETEKSKFKWVLYARKIRKRYML